MSEFRNTTDQRFDRWRKSARSEGTGSCVYASAAHDGSGLVGVCDSKAGTEGAVLVIDRRAWAAFVAGASRGMFVQS